MVINMIPSPLLSLNKLDTQIYPIGSMYGIFSYVWLHVVDLYGICRYIYHTWILWVWVHLRHFIQRWNDKTWKDLSLLLLAEFSLPCIWMPVEFPWMLGFELQSNHPKYCRNWDKMKITIMEFLKKENKETTEKSRVLWRQTSSFQPGRINGNC